MAKYDGMMCGRYGKMTARRRDNLPDKAFGLPRERKYPMPDPKHAASAKGRAKTQLKRGNLTKREYDQIVRKADRVIESCGGHVSGLGRLGKGQRPSMAMAAVAIAAIVGLTGFMVYRIRQPVGPVGQ